MLAVLVTALGWATSARAAAGRYVNGSAGMALLAAAVVASLAIGATLTGLAMLARERRAIADALTAERALVAARRLAAENAIWRRAVARRDAILSQRDSSQTAQETEIATLKQQLDDARRASRVDRSSPVVPGDDPWLRHGAAAAKPGDRPGDRR